MAPATEAPLLLIAAHGERGGAHDNARLAAIAGTVAGMLPHWDVRHGVLSGEPSIASALEGYAGRPVVVWPFFMCRGYFIDVALAALLGDLAPGHVMLPEFGSDPALVAHVAHELDRHPGSIGRHVLAVAHGSTKGSQSRQACERFAENLRAAAPAVTVSCAYLEEPPFAGDAIGSLPAGSVIVSLFAGDGLHGGADMRALMGGTGRSDLQIICPASDTAAVGRVVVDSVRRLRRPARRVTRDLVSGTLPIPEVLSGRPTSVHQG